MRIERIWKALLLIVLLASEIIIGNEIRYWSEFSSNFAIMLSFFFYMVMIMFDVGLLWNFFSGRQGSK